MLIKFIKYNNLFPVILMLLFLGTTASLAANDTVRDGLLSRQEIAQSIDNSYIINAQLTDYDAGLKITGIVENDSNYEVSYSYRTILLEDYAWRDSLIEKQLIVAKSALGERDLGLFVAEQLGQMLDSELAYFRQVQTLERAKGQSRKIISTQYAGLIGRLLDAEDQTFANYQPVLEAVEPEPEVSVALDEQPESERSKSIPPVQAVVVEPEPEPENREEVREEIREMVEEIVNNEESAEEPVVEEPAEAESEEDASDNTAPAPEPIVEPAEVATTTEAVTAEVTATSTEPEVEAPVPVPAPTEEAEAASVPEPELESEPTSL